MLPQSSIFALDTRCTCRAATITYNNKLIYSCLVQREVFRTFVLDTPRIRKPLIRNDRFLDDVQKPSLKRWSRISLWIYLLHCFISVLLFFQEMIYADPINITGRRWLTVFVVTYYNGMLVHTEIDYIVREAHTVGFELGVISYDVELHTNTRW